jgi:hypothetical protein
MLSELRAAEARAKAAFYAGKTDIHPHGLSGLRWIVPPEDGKNMWDTHPNDYHFSEYGNLSGSVR